MSRLLDSSSAGNPASPPPNPLATCQLPRCCSHVRRPGALSCVPRGASWEVLLPVLPAGALSPAHTPPRPSPRQHFLLPPALFLFPFIWPPVLPVASRLSLPVCSGRSQRAVSSRSAGKLCSATGLSRNLVSQTWRQTTGKSETFIVKT